MEQAKMATPNGAVAKGTDEIKPCTIKLLKKTQWVPAATRAIAHNPANAPMQQMLSQGTDSVLPPDHLALLTAKYWGTGGVRLTVSFLDDAEAELRTRIVSHMNAWAAYCNVQFTEVASDGQVRIARTAGEGFWSYLGTDILSVPKTEQTMNLDSFTMDTPESEFHRVIRHETGHTLGFPHEHTTSGIVSRINRQKAITWFMATQGWSEEQVIQQVLTPLSSSAIKATASDVLSIMCYWLPASVMEDGIGVPGGTDIDATDGQFAGLLYPKPA